MLHKKSNHKTKFTPYRDEDGVNRVWLCTVTDKDTGDSANGIAILSPTDEPNIEVGKQIAYNKAVRALEGRSVNQIVKAEAWRAIFMLTTTEFLRLADEALQVESAYCVD